MEGTTLLHEKPIRSAGFRVLRAPDVPSVLIELGYMSDKQDLKSLMSDSWRDRTVDSIAEAIDTYFASHLAGARAGAN
jgi:N-acetylmuramoyl-L-alanine amidase